MTMCFRPDFNSNDSEFRRITQFSNYGLPYPQKPNSTPLTLP